MNPGDRSEGRIGGCFCGKVRYRLDVRPERVTHCHCRNCRRLAGAPFVTWMTFKRSEFEFESGVPARFDTPNGVTRRFCGNCGTQLTYERADEPGTIDVTLGSLDDPGDVEPDDHTWCDRMLPWIRLDDGLPRFARRKSDG